MYTLLDVESNTECGTTDPKYPPRNVFPGYREVGMMIVIMIMLVMMMMMLVMMTMMLVMMMMMLVMIFELGDGSAEHKSDDRHLRHSLLATG